MAEGNALALAREEHVMFADNVAAADVGEPDMAALAGAGDAVAAPVRGDVEVDAAPLGGGLLAYGVWPFCLVQKCYTMPMARWRLLSSLSWEGGTGGVRRMTKIWNGMQGAHPVYLQRCAIDSHVFSDENLKYFKRSPVIYLRLKKSAD